MWGAKRLKKEEACIKKEESGESGIRKEEASPQYNLQLVMNSSQRGRCNNSSHCGRYMCMLLLVQDTGNILIGPPLKQCSVRGLMIIIGIGTEWELEHLVARMHTYAGGAWP